ncbi:Kelch-like protein [Lachnellula suecica]|uniref:Kelch-like protein n=1 Tax=Lachnellula suecica TaxID=602035 RepID=A0A8T9C3N6_9HELO|nr:Kelch-like protein [Lachnellula suecica]
MASSLPVNQPPPSSASSTTLKSESSKDSSPHPEIFSKAQPQQKKRLNFCGKQVFVTFVVGEEVQKFVIHKSLVEHFSPFFEKAFNSDLAEGQTQEMRLPDVDADVFGIVVNWLYTQAIIHTEERTIRIVELAKLWSLAERFQIPELQNQAIQAIDKVETQGNTEDLITELQAYAAVGLSAELEDTQLCRKVMDDVLDVLSIVSHSPDILDKLVMGIFEGGNGAAASFIKSMILRCGSFLSQNNQRRPVEEYFVQVDN